MAPCAVWLPGVRNSCCAFVLWPRGSWCYVLNINIICDVDVVKCGSGARGEVERASAVCPWVRRACQSEEADETVLEATALLGALPPKTSLALPPAPPLGTQITTMTLSAACTTDEGAV